jgi:hypothetical protein
MTIDDIAYWGAFVIPLVLLGMTGVIRKLVDSQSFKREHWYLGLDLTIYFLSATIVNFLDIAKSETNRNGIVWTVILLLSAIVMLLIQLGIHQQWTPVERRSKMQKFMLCYFANGLGILMLYGFVKLKTRGLI